MTKRWLVTFTRKTRPMAGSHRFASLFRKPSALLNHKAPVMVSRSPWDFCQFYLGRLPIDANFYESPSFVKKERTMGASVNLPFVYPSIGASLAPVGCFEVALAAPSVIRAKAQLAFELASTSTGSRLLVAFFPFFPSRLFKNP